MVTKEEECEKYAAQQLAQKNLLKNKLQRNKNMHVSKKSLFDYNSWKEVERVLDIFALFSNTKTFINKQGWLLQGNGLLER